MGEILLLAKGLGAGKMQGVRFAEQFLGDFKLSERGLGAMQLQVGITQPQMCLAIIGLKLSAV